MLFRLYSPPPPLGHFVELLWLYEGFRPTHSRERLLPTGTLEIVLDLREDRILTYGLREKMQPFYLSGSIVCGAHSEFFVIDTTSQDAVMGVHFRPGGAFPFLTLPTGELHNAHADLGMLWGWQDVRDLREQVLAVAKPEQKLRVLERALLGKLRSGFERHPAVAYALGEFHREPEGRSIAAVTERTGVSARRFIELFEKEVGLTPKLFCRVQRFQNVLKVIQSGTAIDWTEIALSCGYYDQAHFIHDFRAFSGINPSTYLAAHTPHLNHVPILE